MGTQRLINLYNAWREQMVDVLCRLGLTSIARAARPHRPAVLPRTTKPARRRDEPRRDRRHGDRDRADLAERLLAEPVAGLLAAAGRSAPRARGRRRLRRHRFACTIPVGGKFIYEPSIQMQNRGNGKGGGIAAAGLVPEELGVSREVLDEHYLLQIALLDPDCHAEVERQFILPYFDIALSTRQPHIDDYRDVPGLEVRPPDVHRYVVRVKPDVLERFAEATGLAGPGAARARRRVRLSELLSGSTTQFYASLGEKRAFVLSHARNLLIFKIVGYAEQTCEYYQLPGLRGPTSGSPTSAIRPRAASGTPAARIRSSG